MFFFPILPKSRRARASAKKLYSHCVEQARQPIFYSEMGVPDTIDGRFDMIALHAGLVVNRLRREGRTGDRIAQAVFDEMFLNMEISCRQIGIGDLSVPKHIKRMMKAFQGRALHYEDAVKVGQNAVAEVLKRNLYATTEMPSPVILALMADYVTESHKRVNNLGLEEMERGVVSFAPLPNIEDKNEKNSQAA